MNRPTSQLILRKRQSLESWQVSLPKTGDNLGFENFLKKWGEVIGGDADGSAAAFVGALWAWKLNKDKGGMNAEFWSDARVINDAITDHAVDDPVAIGFLTALAKDEDNPAIGCREIPAASAA
jgi:hypothetical protein